MKRFIALFFIFFLIAIFTPLAYSQTLPSSQSAGAIQGQEEQLRKEQELEKQVSSKKKKTEEAPETEKAAAVPEEGQKTLVKVIDVQGVTLIPQQVIDKITEGSEGKELSIRDMQKVCDLITDEYRKRGRVTSRAYMPPQTITTKDAVLVIVVIEGKVGNIIVKGNKYFNPKLIKKRLEIKSGEYFDYQALQKALLKINDHPDRAIKVGLVPGNEPGTTDLIVEVQDHLPMHVEIENDDFGSRYMHYIRNTVTLEDNNLTGFDDKLSIKYQQSLGDYYYSPYISYTVPINNRLEVGAYWLTSYSHLGKEYKHLDVDGDSNIGGPFVNYEIINRDAVNLKLTAGFDYTRVINTVSDVETSRDEARVLKGGFNLDVSDPLGRTVVTMEEDVGLLAGGGLYTVDPLATTPGAGAQFQKLTGYVYRLQPMPFTSSILWKNAFQYSNYNLLSVEQFQLGGISNVRGYSPAAYSGDQGYSSSIDWSFPPYFLPKNITVPNSKSTFYDATRFVVFYDVGYASLHDAIGSSLSDRTLQGWGYGIRFNLIENFSSRLEVAYPIDPTLEPSHAHIYWDISKKF